MPKTRLIKYVILAFLLLPLVVFAETKEMKKHKVIKGDTLWHITETELQDPFLWSQIWKANPQIKNPHWIYPGQVIKIPVNLLKKEKKADESASSSASKPAAAPPESVPVIAPPEPEKEAVKEAQKDVAPVKTYPLVDKNKFIISGYISNNIPGVGQFTNSSSEQIFYGNGDNIYVSMDNPAKVRVGDKFYLIRTSTMIEHPITEEDIGYVISIAGIARIIKIRQGEITATITTSFREIIIGDRLIPYYDIEVPMTTGDFRSPDINGLIVATGEDFGVRSMLEIVYLDKGLKDGIRAGDIFMTVEVNERISSAGIPNGVIQVISCRNHTATAIIRSSRSPVSPGNIFAKLGKY